MICHHQLLDFVDAIQVDAYLVSVNLLRTFYARWLGVELDPMLVWEIWMAE